ncbi:MAG: hypothetical protein SU899_04390 [Chloroflexota bacterium]|nr:hypothetical protein [Chloroflexota bacterium]
MEKKSNVVLSVRYCPKCGAGLTSWNYADGMGISYETCQCSSCGLTWQVTQLSSGEVRIAEVSPDEGSPEELLGF